MGAKFCKPRSVSGESGPGITSAWSGSVLYAADTPKPISHLRESGVSEHISAVTGNRTVTAKPQPDECFPPILGRHPHTLILGSLPGRKSLQMQQYYAHPQNAFWKIILQLFGAPSPLPYTRRVKILTDHGIALWDVLAAAERPGSLDSSIVHATARTNDFAAFFRAHPRIRRVFFNGRKAEEFYRRFVLPGLKDQFEELRYECLPSTSPAHAGMTFAKKLEHWAQIRS
jgi:double-stranded uracil-DNA glycosylase